MLGRLVAILVLVASLAAMYLAPQGLLTRPTLSEETAGPFEITSLDTIRATDLWTRLTGPNPPGVAADSDWLPAVLNDRLIDSDAPVALALVRPAGYDSDSTRRIIAGEVSFQKRANCLVARFPYRGAWSPRIGAWKVYRGLGDELQRRGWTARRVLEVYDEAREEIRYITVSDSLP